MIQRDRVRARFVYVSGSMRSAISRSMSFDMSVSWVAWVGVWMMAIWSAMHIRLFLHIYS